MYVSGWSITSAVVDEFAERIPGEHETVWRVSWLPGRLLTRDQAIAAIELVELLYDADRANDRGIQTAIAVAAGVLGIRPIDAAATLSERHPNR
ncbi:hypothetical protein [Nocardia huaxiensis]|uniref:Uncharacterized protein n=1 Tax=Nocardia huaxiensis TaxID=2755382 RepID=A0A7D6ZPQ6_9NOCA|nr:hypothetical protein [Nocardia huaxiensis]QLY30665.1 hypothetical protein H0264_37145 [Nocardia huaxiensis]UFS94156.1 hypothetical protein LPY97_25740 [Nocardia huaxiensis]